MRSDSFLNRIRFKSIPGLRTLSAVMKGDEAYNWLSLIIKPSRLSNMSHQLIWRLLTLFRNTALSYSFIIIVVIGVGILALKDIFKVDITPILGCSRRLVNKCNLSDITRIYDRHNVDYTVHPSDTSFPFQSLDIWQGGIC